MPVNWLSEIIARGKEVALVEGADRVMFAWLANEIELQTESLRQHKVSAGDPVILNSDFSVAGIVTLLALSCLKAIAIPIVNLRKELIPVLKSECGARFLITPSQDGRIESLGASGDHELYGTLRQRNASGLVLLSSGSTGKPKAILHDFDRLLQTRKKAGAHNHVTVLLFLLFDHIGGLNTLIKTLLSGGTAVIPGARHPDAICATIEAQRVNVLPTSPTFLNLVLLSGAYTRHDLSSLRLVTYGTEPMPEELLGRLRATFPKIRFVQTFGTSETGIARTRGSRSASTLFKIDSDSQEFRICNGELQLRSSNQFIGYLNSSEASVTEDGWFRTGDAAELTDDGYIRLRGRLKEVINAGGEKVIPLELETILLGHPEVADCVVYGMPNAITGQAVWVDVLPKGPMNKSELQRSIHQFLVERVPRFKIPSRVTLVDHIQMSDRFKKKRVRL
ncbi:ANL family adenylate-forming protein [Bradyrhizobium sp. STM 3562]|uniref:ANL family adenylate-forming protein n=1 Tax=Bradyrhizobium sp. STM 3562 TaxID=578924 RepID=UPI00388D946E